jgi:hypothetical protein
MIASNFIQKTAHLALVHEFMGRLELAKKVEDSIPAARKNEFYAEIVRQYDRVYMEIFDARNHCQYK